MFFSTSKKYILLHKWITSVHLVRGIPIVLALIIANDVLLNVVRCSLQLCVNMGFINLVRPSVERPVAIYIPFLTTIKFLFIFLGGFYFIFIFKATLSYIATPVPSPSHPLPRPSSYHILIHSSKRVWPSMGNHQSLLHHL